MPTLTSVQLAELRRAWVFDEYDEGPPVVARSIFNRRYTAAFFEDADLQDMADRAIVRWPQTDIDDEDYVDNERLLFRAIQVFAFEQYQGSDAYIAALGEQSGAVREAWSTRIENDRMYLNPSVSNAVVER